MKVLEEENLEVDYIIIKIGDKVYSTDIHNNININIAKKQKTDTKGIGLQVNQWVKGLFTHKKNKEKLEQPVPFELNVYMKPKEEQEKLE